MALDARVAARLPDLHAWARARPAIRRLWIYGSRARGTHRDDSDLDIAFEIDRLGTREAAEQFQAYTRVAWRSELSLIFGLNVHLEPVVGDATNVEGYVQDSGTIAYERNDPRDCVT